MVDTGKEKLQVVCGAPNVREGAKVVLATVGSKIGNAVKNNGVLNGTKFKNFGTKVSIKTKKDNKGKIEIEYYSPEELDRILELLMYQVSRETNLRRKSWIK